MKEETPEKRKKLTSKEDKGEKDEKKQRKEEDGDKEETATPIAEKKKSYFAFKAREGPRNLGAKEVPQVRVN